MRIFKRIAAAFAVIGISLGVVQISDAGAMSMECYSFEWGTMCEIDHGGGNFEYIFV